MADHHKIADALRTIKEAGLIPIEKVRLCVVADGADWIWNRVEELFPDARQVMDFYHCSEYLHKVAAAQYGKGSEKVLTTLRKSAKMGGEKVGHRPSGQ